MISAKELCNLTLYVENNKEKLNELETLLKQQALKGNYSYSTGNSGGFNSITCQYLETLGYKTETTNNTSDGWAETIVSWDHLKVKSINKQSEYKFDWDLILQPGVVVRCDKEEKAKSLFKEADKKGFTWSSGKRYLDEHDFYIFSSNYCYSIVDGTYADIDYYRDNNCIILSYEEVLLTN